MRQVILGDTSCTLGTIRKRATALPPPSNFQYHKRPVSTPLPSKAGTAKSRAQVAPTTPQLINPGDYSQTCDSPTATKQFPVPRAPRKYPSTLEAGTAKSRAQVAPTTAQLLNVPAQLTNPTAPRSEPTQQHHTDSNKYHGIQYSQQQASRSATYPAQPATAASNCISE